MILPSLLLVNDLSGYSKVAISATLPLLATCRIETSLLPSVLLSTHTAFQGAYRHALTSSMLAMLNHWRTLNLSFDAILTGYFNDETQIDCFLHHLPTSKLLIVDPVMADNGQLYTGFSETYPQKMRELCQHASIIMPNLTEACLLAGIDYLTTYTVNDIHHLLTILSKSLQVDTVIITGISFDEQTIGAMFLQQGTYDYCLSSYIPKHFFGTGDMFSALITAFILNNIPLKQAIQQALQFIVSCLNDTLLTKRDIKHGVIFEKQLWQLQHIIKGESL